VHLPLIFTIDTFFFAEYCYALDVMRAEGESWPSASAQLFTTRQTRSGTVFAAWTPSVNSLCATAFDFAPLVAQAVAVQDEDQEDEEPEDHINNIDEEWPPNPLNEVDEEWPPPDPWNQVDDLPQPLSSHKRAVSPTFNDLLATGQPHKGCHRHCAAKCARSIREEGYMPCTSTVAQHVKPATPLYIPSLDAVMLPATHGAYTSKVEDKDEKYGAKKRRSLAELIALGFQLVRWDGMQVPPPIPLAEADLIAERLDLL
jgi:hypothetical protein